MRISDWSSGVCSSDLLRADAVIGFGGDGVLGGGDDVTTDEWMVVNGTALTAGHALHAIGGEGGDSFVGGAGNDVFTGNDGDDFVLGGGRSEEHTSELQSLMRISYAVFCLKKKNKRKTAK